MNYLITKNKAYFEKIGLENHLKYNFCKLEEMQLTDTLGIDSETTGLEARFHDMFCLQIGTGEDNYIIDFYTSKNSYTFEDVIPFLQDKTLVFHNAQFDLTFFYKHNFYPEKIKDTILASRILYNGDVENMRHDFGTCMRRELNVFYDKTDQKNINVVKLSQPSTIEYSFNDVDKLLALEEELNKKIVLAGCKETYILHCNYIRALAYMQECGLGISSKRWKEKMEKDIENTLKFKKEIEEYIFDNAKKFADRQIDMFDNEKKVLVNLASPQQMIKIFQFFNIPTKDKDGKDSINESIISKSKHEFVGKWLQFQEANHRVSTFGEGIFKQIENERIFTNFNSMVDTARLSTRKGHINFLNFPSDKETRNCFVPKEGNAFIVCDYDAQEGVIMADHSKDEAMVDSVLHGVDLHCLLTKKIFTELEDLSDEEIKTKHKDKRNVSKVVRFAMSYGATYYTLHTNQNIPIAEAMKIESSFKELHAGLYRWGDENFRKAIDIGYIQSADGWRLKLPNFKKYKEYEEKIKKITREQWKVYKEGKIQWKAQLKAKEEKVEYKIVDQKSYDFYRYNSYDVSQYFKLQSEYKRLSLNSPVQSCGSHMTKRATLLLFNWIVQENLQDKVLISSTIHDECLIECPEELIEITKAAVEKCMKEGANYYLTDLKMNCTANEGQSWYQAK